MENERFLTLKVPYSDELAKEFSEFLELSLMSYHEIFALSDEILETQMSELSHNIKLKKISQVYYLLLKAGRKKIARKLFKIIDDRSKGAKFDANSVEIGGVRDAFEQSMIHGEEKSYKSFLKGRTLEKTLLKYIGAHGSIEFIKSMADKNLKKNQITYLFEGAITTGSIKSKEIVAFYIKNANYKLTYSTGRKTFEMLTENFDSNFADICINEKNVLDAVKMCIKQILIQRKRVIGSYSLLEHIFNKKLFNPNNTVENSTLLWKGLQEKDKAVEFIEFLIKHGVDLTQSCGGISPVEKAMKSGSIKIVELLSKNGVYSQKEMLLRAVGDQNITLVKKCLEDGVDPTRSKLNGNSLVEYARSKRNYELTNLLQEYSANF